MTKTSFEKLLAFLNKYSEELKLPVADYGGTTKTKPANIVKQVLKSGGITDYHILDLESGTNLEKPIKGKYGTGLCMDMLEHAEKPWLVAKNISDSLKKDALLFVTAPFSWEFHFHPGDYWRFTQDGLKSLFSDLEFIEGDNVRDYAEDESITRIRVVAIFRKIK
jgi:hypothetical protein